MEIDRTEKLERGRVLALAERHRAVDAIRLALQQFVQQQLTAGHSRSAINEALRLSVRRADMEDE